MSQNQYEEPVMSRSRDIKLLCCHVMQHFKKHEIKNSVREHEDWTCLECKQNQKETKSEIDSVGCGMKVNRVG